MIYLRSINWIRNEKKSVFLSLHFSYLLSISLSLSLSLSLSIYIYIYIVFRYINCLFMIHYLSRPKYISTYRLLYLPISWPYIYCHWKISLFFLILEESYGLYLCWYVFNYVQLYISVVTPLILLVYFYDQFMYLHLPIASNFFKWEVTEFSPCTPKMVVNFLANLYLSLS